MSKRAIFLNEFLKITAIVLFGILVIFPLITAFQTGFNRSIVKIYSNQFSNMSLWSIIALFAIMLMIAYKNMIVKYKKSNKDDD